MIKCFWKLSQVCFFQVFLFKFFEEDSNIQLKKLDELIKNYQDPKEADKLLKLEFTLKEVTNIVHKNLEDVKK